MTASARSVVLVPGRSEIESCPVTTPCPPAADVGIDDRAVATSPPITIAPARLALRVDTTRSSPPLPADSLAERLKRAEEAIALLREQIAAQAEASVQSASRVRVELFGRVLANGFVNTDSVNNNDVPQFAAPNANCRNR